MADREKVIKTIYGCINDDSFCNKCDYEGCVFQHGSCEKDLLADALALLKEQKAQKFFVDESGKITPLPIVFPNCPLEKYEAVKPRISSVEQRCGNCNKVIEMDGWIACPWCGKPILWEGRRME